MKLDNSKRAEFVRCPYKYYLTYIRNIQPVKGSTALRYGSVWHKAMEGYYSHIKENGWARDGGAITQAIEFAQKSWNKESEKQVFYDDYRTLENLLKSFITYCDHFANDEGILKILEPERVFKIWIEPDTEKFPFLKPFWFTGRIDLEVELSGRPWILEFKTTGQNLSIQMQRLHRSPQQMGYTFASSKVLNATPDGSLVVLHYLSAYKSKKTELYGEAKIDFDRVPQIFSDSDINNWLDSLCYTAQQIQWCEEQNIYPKIFDSCYTYGPCSLINLCEQGRPIGEEMLYDAFQEREPWDVTEGAGDKLITIT